MSEKDGKMLLEIAVPEMGQRVSYFLRQTWPRNTAKLAARAGGCNERTAKDWLSGNLPSNKHMAILASKLGWSFVQFVYEPAVGSAREIKLIQRLDETEARLDELRNEIKEARLALDRPYSD